MTERRRFGFSWLLGLLLPLWWGCAVEAPYPTETTPPAPSAPLSIQDVLEFLDEGIGESAILARVEFDGLAARPTMAEIQALRNIGASDRLILGLLTAAVPYPVETLRAAEIDVGLLPAWPPFMAIPRPRPLPCRHGLEGKWWLDPHYLEPLP